MSKIILINVNSVRIYIESKDENASRIKRYIRKTFRKVCSWHNRATANYEENKYISWSFKIVTKFSKTIPVENQEASTIAKTFIIKIIIEHGILEKIFTDQSTNTFTREVFKNICKLLKIEKTMTYHSENNRALKRSYWTLAEYLWHYINNE